MFWADILLFILSCCIRPCVSIKGGYEIKSWKKYSFMVAPFGGESTIECGAILVHPMFVLTAAHCVCHGNLKLLTVVLAQNALYRDEIVQSDLWPVDIVHFHPEFSCAEQIPLNNLGLLRLGTPVPADLGRPIALMTEILDDSLPKTVELVGWGQTEKGQYSVVLQAVETELWPVNYCRNVLHGYQVQKNGVQVEYNKLTHHAEMHICTNDTMKGKPADAAQGDGGGPVILRIPGKAPVLIGIISSSLQYIDVKSGRRYTAGVGVSIAYFADWIMDIIGSSFPIPGESKTQTLSSLFTHNGSNYGTINNGVTGFEDENSDWIITALTIAILLLTGSGGVVLLAIWKRRKLTESERRRDYTDILLKLVPHALIEAYELPRWSVRLTDNCVGYGQSGQVVKGFVKLRNTQNQVNVSDNQPAAIKILRKAHTTSREEAEFLLEMSILMKIGRHRNIVSLEGIILKEKLMIVMEYCELGALDEYLRFLRLFSASCSRPDISTPEEPLCGHLIIDEGHNTINEKALISFACQISCGMAYLVSKDVIHRDLAARNILVTNARILKIADVGMARCQLEYVLERDQVLLLARWMAPESIVSARGVFSVASDVWSFGVVMWEIFTLGEMPYAVEFPKGLVYDQLCAFLSEGNRLSIPELCSASLAALMNECWSFVPSGRPTFGELCRKLAGQLLYDVAAQYVTFDAAISDNREWFPTVTTEAEN